MKTINWITLIYIVLTHYGCGANGEKTKGTPQAEFLKDTFNFSKVKKGDTVDVSFSLKNSGTADVFIKSNSVSCGCTKVTSLKDTIAPGETVDLKLIYDTKSDSGNVLKTFVVETNTNPKLHVLFIKGFVE